MNKKFEKRLLTIVAVLLIVIVSLLFIAWRQSVAGSSVAFLDVGQGDATLITFDSGQQMLIDCGATRAVLEGLGKHMPFYDRTLEYLVITHPDLDHYGGCIDVLKSYEVKNVWHVGLSAAHASWVEWESVLSEEKAEQMIIEKQGRVEIGGAMIDILYPDHSLQNDPRVPGVQKKGSPNNASVVLKIQIGERTYLFTGDAEKELELYLVEQYGARLDSDVLQVGHHGSNSSSIDEFLEAVSPEISVISAGKKNRYGHPTTRVLRRLERHGSVIRRTDVQGDIIN